MFKNKRIWRIVLFSLCWVVFLAGLVVSMSFIDVKKQSAVCKDVQVIIPGSQYFIDKQEVDNILGLNSHMLIGRRLDNINIHALEKRLKANPFIEFVKVYTDMDGIITVEISQRQPLMRIINKGGQDFYIDQHGLKIPLSDNFTARVLVANGEIDELYTGRIDTLKSQLAKDLFRTAVFIGKDSLWTAQIAQLYVNPSHEIELVPRVGNQHIILGTADSLEVKLANLKAFYKQAIPQVGWDAYKVINVKYPNQVIGIKNENLKRDTATIKKDTLTTSIRDTTQIKN